MAGLNLNIPAIMRERFKLTEFWVTLYRYTWCALKPAWTESLTIIHGNGTWSTIYDRSSRYMTFAQPNEPPPSPLLCLFCSLNVKEYEAGMSNVNCRRNTGKHFHYANKISASYIHHKENNIGMLECIKWLLIRNILIQQKKKNVK